MKKLILFLLILPLVFAQPTDWFKSAQVKTELNVSSYIDLTSRGPSPFVESLRADVVFVPQNSDFLAVRSFDSSPPAVMTGDRASFSWRSPDIGRVPFEYSALVEVANNAPRVRSKIPYPLKFPQTLNKYIKPTQNIDSDNAKVVGQANYLAQGEDDLFLLVSKIAIWVKNDVKYNLSTLTADVSQPASWVLENRYGVCDEITSLFIAMLRSLRIPARFVSGLAFTNSPQFPQGWGAHGWAEVYFPGVGWVPFDVTFGEFGWVDPGHIKLKESLDPSEPTTLFEWKARDVDVQVRDLTLSAVVLDAQGSVPFELKTAISPLRARVGFGSYNGVVLDVENLADYYVGSEFTLTRVNDMQILDGESRQIVLPPKGRGNVFWEVKVRDELDPNFQYELPIQVYTIRKDMAQSAFAVGKWDVAFTKSDVDSQIARLSATQRDDLELACALENDMIWDSNGKVNCIVQNRGAVELSVSVCSAKCVQLTVPAKQSVPVSFEVLAEHSGPTQVEVAAIAGSLTKKAVLTLVRLDAPKISITGVSAPAEVNYGESFTLLFTLARESVAFPQNVSVRVVGGGAEALVDVGEIVVDQEVRVNIRSDQLYSRNPDFKITASYMDVFGESYSSTQSATVRVEGVPWYKRLFSWVFTIF